MTVLYFPFIRLLGLPIVDIYIYIYRSLLYWSHRGQRVHITQTSKNNTDRASPPGIRFQQRKWKEKGGAGNSTREEESEGRGEMVQSESLA